MCGHPEPVGICLKQYRSLSLVICCVCLSGKLELAEGEEFLNFLFQRKNIKENKHMNKQTRKPALQLSDRKS